MKTLTTKQLPSFRRWLYIDQHRKCGLCEEHVEFNEFVVDHDHNTGHIRKGLCSNCNKMEGFAQGKKELLSEKVVKYLEADYSLNAIYPGYERQAFEERRKRWSFEKDDESPVVLLFS